MSVISTADALDRRELKEAAVDHVLDNMDEYDDPVDYEALGLAIYTEDVITGARDDIDRTDISSYIAENDLDDQRFIEYKAGLASDYDEFVDFMGDFIDMRDGLINDIESEGVFYQALYEEARNERDNAERALGDILEFARDSRTDSDWFEDIPDRTEDDTATPDVDMPESPDSGGFSGGFSTWSNYNFGVQDVSGLSTWSNYNFGVQGSGFEDVEVIEGELNEDLFEEREDTESWNSAVYNPQINFSPTININGVDEDFNLDRAV